VSESEKDTKSLRIVFISSCNPTEVLIMNEIARTCNIVGVVKTYWQAAPRKKESWQKILFKNPLKSAINLINQYSLSRQLIKRSRVVSSLLPECAHLPESFNVIDVPSAAINSQVSVAKIASLRPDVILVGGAPILKPEIFSLARLACFNIHYGIAPKYRGEHTIFWPMMKGDFDNIGITIHHVAKKVDAGGVVAYGFPELSPEDNEYTIIYKCSWLASELLIDLVKRIAGSPGAVFPGYFPPHEKGQLIRYRDRKVWHDMICALKWNRSPEKPERKVIFYPVEVLPSQNGNLGREIFKHPSTSSPSTSSGQAEMKTG